MVYLTAQPAGKLSSISEIATRENIPRNFLAKILKDLQRAGILKSYPGAAGGYRLARPPQEITYRMVVEAGQGSVTEPAEGNNHRTGPASPAVSSIFGLWNQANDAFVKVLDSIRVSDLPAWTAPADRPVGGDSTGIREMAAYGNGRH